MTDITPVIQAVVALAAALITAFVIPWLKNKVGAQNMDLFLAWVDIAVAAAEQLYDTVDGEKKKAYVVNFLAQKGFKVDTEELDNAIEAAVLKLHNELYGWADIVEGIEVQNDDEELEAVPVD
mgnify:CR=1 FL=1